MGNLMKRVADVAAEPEPDLFLGGVIGFYVVLMGALLLQYLH